MAWKTIDKATLETAFIEFLETITPKQDWMNMFEATVLDLWQEQGFTFEVEAKKYDNQVAELKAKQKKIYDAHEAGAYSKELFLERNQEVENQIAAASISRSEARIEQFDIQASIAYAKNFIANLGRQWFDLPYSLRPKFQKLVLPEGIIYSNLSKLDLERPN